MSGILGCRPLEHGLFGVAARIPDARAESSEPRRDYPGRKYQTGQAEEELLPQDLNACGSERGKPGGIIACALAHRASKIAFAMVRDQAPYDPARWS